MPRMSPDPDPDPDPDHTITNTIAGRNGRVGDRCDDAQPGTSLRVGVGGVVGGEVNVVGGAAQEGRGQRHLET